MQIAFTREQTINVALALGKVLLKNGAETTRVEDTITRFCQKNGIYDLNVFVTPVVIILGDELVDGCSCICRIRFRGTNLSVISEVNDFSYKWGTGNYTYEEAMAWLDSKLVETPPYGKWTLCGCSGFASACFAMLLGGNSHDFVGAFLVGFLSMLMIKQLSGIRPSVFWENVLAGFAIGALAICCCISSRQCTLTNIIVGAVMPFVPGVAFTNGVRDYMSGHLIAGNCRIAEALLFAVAIAIGLAFALRLWFLWGWDLWRLT